MQKKDDTKRFQNVNPCLGGNHIDFGVLSKCVVIEQLCGSGGYCGNKAIEF